VGHALPSEADRAFASITEAYLCQRFGGASGGSDTSDFEKLRSCLRRTAISSQRTAISGQSEV